MISSFVVLVACTGQRLPHGGESPEFALIGAHAAVPCEGCHGDGKPEAQSTVCIDCHADDTPTPDHFTGQNCGECHTEYGWDTFVAGDADTDSDSDSDADSDTDSDADTDPAFDHSGLAPDTQCQTCHEKDRDTPDHNEGWDCSPCHTPTAWDDRPVQHPIRTPHGVDEIVACADCHPSGPPAADCVTCHLPDKLSTQHYTVSPNPDPDDSQFPGTCIDACHPTGEL